MNRPQLQDRSIVALPRGVLAVGNAAHVARARAAFEMRRGPKESREAGAALRALQSLTRATQAVSRA